MAQSRWITRAQAYRDFGVGRRTLDRLIQEGAVRTTELPGSRTRLVSRDDVAEAMTPRDPIQAEALADYQARRISD
jgi:excisionase family DNA binding protein